MTPGSLAVKAKLALVSVVEAGGVDASVTVGAVVSGGEYRNWTLAGFPTFPALSVARTENWWLPAARPESAVGLLHGEYAAASSLQANLAPASLDLNPI